MSQLWDQLDNQQEFEQNDKPIWTLDLESKEKQGGILKWLKSELQKLRHQDQQRVEEVQRHYKLYKGISTDRIHRDNDRDNETDRAQVQRKIVVNHLYDLTEQRVSRVSKFKPAIAVLPNNDEHEDKQHAKMAQKLFQYLKDQLGLDMKAQSGVRYSLVAGEGYLWVEWDPDAGELAPAYKKLVEENGGKPPKVPLKDDQGNHMTDPNTNKKLYIEKPVHIGEVKYEVIRPELMFFEQERDFKDCKYVFKISYKHVEEIRSDYPNLAADIKASKDEDLNQYNRHFTVDIPYHTMIAEFYHLPTKHLPKGRYIKFTNDVILENKDYPYDHGKWPFARLTDIDMLGERHARSWYINGRVIAAQINNITTMAMRNIKWLSSPKWMVPKGAANITHLNNNVGIVEYQGPVAPSIATPSTISPELLRMKEELKQDLQQTFGASGVSRGEPPPGIKAGVALQFMNEMENERLSSFVAKYNNWIKCIAELTLKVAGQYYDENDGRMLNIYGKNSELMRVDFDIAALGKPYSVMIQNSSALSESKAQRTQNIFDISERFPTILSEEQIADMLELGQSDKFYSEATAATRAAEMENDMLLDGKEVDAEEWEYHIQHWVSHVTEIQKPGFKNLPEGVQESFQDHILTHEMHMDTTARKNPAYMERLQVLSQFPLFFTPDHLAPKSIPEPIDPLMAPGGLEQQVNSEDIQQVAELQAEQELAQQMDGIVETQE